MTFFLSVVEGLAADEVESDEVVTGVALDEVVDDTGGEGVGRERILMGGC